MNAAALMGMAAAGIGLVAGSVRVLGFLQKQRERRANAQSAAADKTLPLLPIISVPAPPDAFPLAPASSAPALPPRDHFALSRGDGIARTLPDGVVTLLFTDIVGSTRFWQEQPALMAVALARHDALLHALIPQHRGHVFKTVGDAFYAVFSSASDGVAAALAVQQAMRAEPWHPDVSLHIRLALHSGVAQQRNHDYFGPALNRAARMLAAGHGDQVLVSEAAHALIRDSLPADATLRALGLVRLRDLAQPEPLYQLLHPALPDNFLPLRSLDTLPNNLPQPMTSFIGREKESAEVKVLLSGSRLLSLLGAGGVGKSRLAVQVAADGLDQYPDGVWLAELGPLTEGALVAQEVARVLRVPEEPNLTVSHSLTQALGSKHLLLILDNCEHVLPACAALADLLLRHCPQVRILATSRQALQVNGEQVYPVPSLALPTGATATVESLAQSECARLFVDRAMLHQPGFHVTASNASAVAEICTRLDGIPLAIELGAARVGALSVEEINERLDNRFRLLTHGSRTALPRQQTLRALIDWSYNLLDDAERRLLCRLSVFSGGWTAQAAEAICAPEGGDADVLDGLTGLVGKSLVQTEQAGGRTRYRLLETVRQYSRDRLEETGETRSLRDRHRRFFLALAQQADTHLFGPAQGQWLNVLEADHDNLRAAQDACLADDTCADDALLLAAVLRPFWTRRGFYREGLGRATAALAHSEGAGETSGRADAFRAAGILARQMGDYPSAQAFMERGLDVCRALGDRRRMATALSSLGSLALNVEQFGRARDLFAEGLALSREMGDALNAAYSLVFLGQAHYRLGEYETARALEEEALGEMRALETDDGIAAALGNLASVALAQADHSGAGMALREGTALYQKMGNRMGIASALDSLAALALARNALRRATRLLGACASLYQDLGVPQSPADQAQFDAMRAQAQEALPPAGYAFCWEQGQAMSAEAAVAYALEPEDGD